MFIVSFPLAGYELHGDRDLEYLLTKERHSANIVGRLGLILVFTPTILCHCSELGSVSLNISKAVWLLRNVESELFGYKSVLCFFPSANFLPSLRLNFHTCKVGTVVLLHKVVGRIK